MSIAIKSTGSMGKVLVNCFWQAVLERMTSFAIWKGGKKKCVFPHESSHASLNCTYINLIVFNAFKMITYVTYLMLYKMTPYLYY